ncbi:hypothetical protein HC928_00305 [bacterium]|nr:hypothetical protein [bacterium]
MKTFDGYELRKSTSGKEDGPTIWWDGERVRASTDKLLRELKRIDIPFGNKQNPVLSHKDGEDFFEQLPRYYNNGYQWLKKVKVNEKGEKVK